jgi:predicted nucleotidyltransferase component of viral defense system
MIERGEILAVAGDLSLAADVVEKDYVLGWLLAGIHSRPDISTWIFKGGTCLKKCFFETYRFSEDLDFTLADPQHLEAAFLQRAFSEVSSWMREHSGIEIPEDRLRFDVYRNNRGGLSCEGRIYYTGPLQRARDPARIKLDLTNDEVVVVPPVERPVGHPYTDVDRDRFAIRCYAFEELFAEKVRALAERSRPRDLYDVINLSRHEEFRPQPQRVLEVLARKCQFKGIPVPRFADLGAAVPELRADWQAMLAHQLPALPPFESFWEALPGFFAWLERGARPAPLPAAPLAEGEVVIRPAVGTLRRQGIGGSSYLETIRFAASNRLCVDLDYVDENGRRRVRTIEPYSLRRTREGRTLLFAVRSENAQLRSYRVDRIRGAHVTATAFVPRYPIELAPTEFA